MSEFIEVQLRRAYRLLHPKIVVLVVSVDPSGRANGMPAAWVMPASTKPPLICVALSPKRYTYRLIKNTRDFTINVMATEHVKEVDYMGSVSGKDVDKFARVSLTLERSKTVKSPMIREALAALECTFEGEYEAGDHMLILGRITRALAKRGVFEEIYKLEKAKVLLHLGGENYGYPADSIVHP